MKKPPCIKKCGAGSPSRGLFFDGILEPHPRKKRGERNPGNARGNRIIGGLEKKRNHRAVVKQALLRLLIDRIKLVHWDQRCTGQQRLKRLAVITSKVL